MGTWIAHTVGPDFHSRGKAAALIAALPEQPVPNGIQAAYAITGAIATLSKKEPAGSFLLHFQRICF